MLLAEDQKHTLHKMMLSPLVTAPIQERTKRYKFQGASNMCFLSMVLELFFANVLNTNSESRIFQFWDFEYAAAPGQNVLPTSGFSIIFKFDKISSKNTKASLT